MGCSSPLSLFCGAWLGGTSLLQIHMIGFLLGFAGASFAVSLSLASRWYPPQYQGLAMGIAGAGNSGTALATFFVPQIAQAYGWHSVFGVALIPLAIVMIWLKTPRMPLRLSRSKTTSASSDMRIPGGSRCSTPLPSAGLSGSPTIRAFSSMTCMATAHTPGV